MWSLAGDYTAERYTTLDTGGTAAYTVAFAPERPQLAAGASDGSLHLWQFDTGAAVERICEALGDTITADEWERFLADRPYDPPCRTDR